MTSIKRCNKCSREKPLENFTFDKRKSDGHSGECRECNRARARSYYSKNRETVIARTRQYHEENREWRATYYQQYYEDRKPLYRSRRRAWHQDNKERAAQMVAEWQKQNPDLVRLAARNHQSKRRAQMAGGVSTKEISSWLEEQSGDCFYCGNECGDTAEIDHYMPLARGGAHELDNFRLACAPCNRRKNARDPIEFIESLAAGLAGPR